MAKEMEVKVPDIGDYHDVPVIEVLVKAGDKVEKDASLVTLESDKATLDVPAPDAGTVKSVTIRVGDKVSKGHAVLVLEVGGGVASAVNKESPNTEPAPKAAGSKVIEPKKLEPEKPSKSPSEESTNIQPISVPDIGDYKDVPVIEVMVKDGDQVGKDATLLVLESDKSTLDVPAPRAGIVKGLKIKVGDKVSKGSVICSLEGPGGAEAQAPSSESKPSEPKSSTNSEPRKAANEDAPGNLGEAPAPAPASPLPAQSVANAQRELPYASPSIRKFARELGVDLRKVSGSGAKGRITQDDVQGFVKKALTSPESSAPQTVFGVPPIPTVDFSQFGEIETKPLARIRKLSAAHLHRSWMNLPHVTQTDEADITELEAFRKSQNDEFSSAGGGTKLTLLPFVLKACARAMEAFPEFNASLSPDGEALIVKKYLNIGFAADTPNGLVVPVVRDVNRKGIVALAHETAELAKKARDGKLKADEMKGGCFSVSSLGGIGGGLFTPIINAPEVAILGVSRGVMRPVWDGLTFQPRLMLPLSLSYDHRVIDGAYGARFIVHLVKLLGDLRRLAL